MFVNFYVAKNWFERLSGEYRYPTIDPEYIQLETLFNPKREAIYYLVESGDKFYYVAGYLTYSDNGIIDFETPRGYGGVVTNIKEMTELEKLQSKCGLCFKERGVLCGFIRNIPILNNHTKTSLRSWRDRSTLLIDLENPDLLQSYKVRARTAVKKAQKSGVVIHEANSTAQWQEFASLYANRMAELNASSEYCYDIDYFLELEKLSSASLILAYLDGKLISGCVILKCGNYSEYYLSASSKCGMKYASTQACLHYSAQMSRENGAKFMHLGGGLSDNENDSLYFFKSGFTDKHLDFFVSSWIFDGESYRVLKEKYEAQVKTVNRVIFYR